MDSNTHAFEQCLFCGGQLRLQHQGVQHTFKPDHGPFDIYLCNECKSCQTNPPPSIESLASLYGSYRDGLPDLHRNITADDPQTSLYQNCIKRISRLAKKNAKDDFKWIDVGSGGGEFSALMSTQFPNSHGMAIDLHTRPHSLANTSVDWQQIDINQENFSKQLPQFNLIASIAVLEHVLRPDLFISNLLKLLQPGGMIYLLCPNNASWASRLLQRKWPYFTPGEHLAIPTPRGAVRCVQREWQSLQNKDSQIKVHSQAVLMSYTLRYVMRRLGIDKIGRMLPPGLSLPLPSGALEIIVTSE